MKMLNSLSLHTSLEELQSKLKTQQHQLIELQKAIENFTGSKDQFSGQGGEAIRSFYQDFHSPFLTFFTLTLLNYEKVLSSLKSASLQLEGSANGHIHLPFLEGELTTSLKKTEIMTIDLVDEANHILQTIDDIVHTPSIQDQKFLADIKNAQQEIIQTMEDVRAFDSDQTKNLDTVDHDIQLLKRYIYDIERMFQNGNLNVTQYIGIELEKSFHHHQYMNTLNERMGSRRLLLSKLTVSSEYDSLQQLLLLDTSGEVLSTRGIGSAQTAYGVCYPNHKNTFFTKKIEDQFNSDGSGNAEFSYRNDKIERRLNIEGSASIFDTKYMDNTPGFLEQKVIYGQMDADIPYSFKAFGNDVLYGQNIGVKTEAAVSKTTFSHDNSPVALDFNFAQAEGKTNIENYTVAVGGSVSATKLELKVEPFNFFGYEPLDEWFGIEYDPYIGADLALGSIGVGGSVGLETSVYAALGIGVGLKGGFQKDEE